MLLPILPYLSDSMCTVLSFRRRQPARRLHPAIVRRNMGESRDSSPSPSSWESCKRFFSNRFAYLDHYRFAVREEKLPAWSDSEVDQFISSDPVHGPTLRTAREAAKFALVGSAISGVSTAGFCWRYSKSPHGALLGLGFGAVAGSVVGKEVANHWLQLYRLDTMTAQTKFMEWWEKKASNRY